MKLLNPFKQFFSRLRLKLLRGVKSMQVTLSRALFLRPPTLAECGMACNRLIVWSVRVVLLWLLVVGLALTYLSFKPLSLTPYLQHIEPHLTVKGYTLQLDKLWLKFDGALQLEGRGVSVTSPVGSPVLSAFKLDVELSNRELFLGRLSPKHVVLDGAALAARISSTTLVVGDVHVPLGRDADESKQNELDIIAWLNDEAEHPTAYKTLKTLELRNTLLRAELIDKNEIWRFVDTNIRFSKYFRHGEQLAITTVVHMGDYELPAMFVAEHPTNADITNLRLRLERSDTEIIQSHLPDVLKNRVKAEAKILLKATLEAKNKITKPGIELTFGPGTLDASELYVKPLTFNRLYIKGMYDEAAHTAHLDDFTFEDTEGSTINVKGTVSDMASDNPHANLKGSGTFGVVEQFLDYLPDAVIPETQSWLKHGMNGKIATMDNLQFAFKGHVKNFPFIDEDPETDYKVTLDFKDLDLSFAESVPPARRMTGKLNMSGSRISAVADTAILSLQDVSQISTTIDGLFVTKDPDLYVTLAAEGEIEDVLGIVFNHVERGDFAPVEGRHSSSGWLKLPLIENVQFDDAIFKLESDLVGLESELPYIKQPFESAQGYIQVTDKKLDFQAPSRVAGRDVILNWQEDMKAFGDKTQVQADGILPDADANDFTRDLGLTIKGEVPYTLNLTRLPEENLFEFALKAPLDASEISSTLNWYKADGVSALLDMRGRIDETGQELWLDMLSFRAKGAEILGSAILPKDLSKATIQLNPFKVGRTDMFVDYDKGNLSLMGSGLDVSALQKTDNASDEPWTLPEGKLSVNLRNLYLPKLNMTNIEGSLTRDGYGWREGKLIATLPGGKPASLNMVPQQQEKLRRLNLYAEDAGHMLQALDLYDNIRGGSLAIDMSVTRQYGLMSFEGEGPFTIHNGHVINAPIIARILSLLWPGQLFSPQKGIGFDKIDMHLTMMEKQLLVKRAVMSGPSLGLRFDGKLNLEAETLDAKGSIIPVEGINKMVGSIPIVGKILTGSQDALVAADFTVKGKFDDPQVFVNPLSVVTPGLVKDIFGALFDGGDDNKPIENNE